MTKNKKGDIVIVVFVIMTLALSSTILTMTYLGNKGIKSEFKNPGEVSNIYAEVESLNFDIYYTLKNSMIDSYNEIVLSGEYISDSPECIVEGQRTFCGLNNNLNNVIHQKVLAKFLTEISSEINKLKENLKVKNINLLFDITKLVSYYNGFFNLTIANNTLVYTSDKKDLIIRHIFDIAQEMKFEDIGLDSFEKINEKISLCQSADFKLCFKLDNFDVSFEDIEISNMTFVRTTLTSKKEVYLGGNYQKLGFSFLVKI